MAVCKVERRVKIDAANNGNAAGENRFKAAPKFAN